MSQITRPAITAEIAAKLADNTVGAITPAVIRGVMQDVTDSANIPATDGANQPLSTVLSSLSLSPTVVCAKFSDWVEQLYYDFWCG